MRFDLLTIFPEFFQGPLNFGIVARARDASLIDIAVHNLRDYTHDRHRTTDDRPFGGGEGMVMKPEPVYECLGSILGNAARAERANDSSVLVCLLSAQGRQFNQAIARQYAARQRIVLICGRYEGVDERVAEYMADDELSIGDFVLSGGELAAAVVLDCVARLVPGVLGHADSAVNESFSAGESGAVLDYPQYTRPVVFQGWEVPAVLRSGDHEAIRAWRAQEALRKTRTNRPDLLDVQS